MFVDDNHDVILSLSSYGLVYTVRETQQS